MACSSTGTTSKSSNGGYKHNLDFVDVIHERFFCSVCTKVMKDPYLVVCCGQKYCKRCLQSWLKTQSTPTCLHCRAAGRRFQHVVERGMKSEIESFHVLCPHHTSGCEWIGELRNLDNHLQSEDGCEFYEVVCPNKCQNDFNEYIKIQRGELQYHLQQLCLLRQISCIYCSEIITAKQYYSHEAICTMFPMECPNKCGEQGVVRKTIDAHRLSCMNEVILCTYAHAGCTRKMKRRDLDRHLTNSQTYHLQKMSAEFDKLKQEREELQAIVHQELKLAKHEHLDREYWLLSLETQFQDSRNLDTTDLYFRMMNFQQISSGQCNWSSPTFSFRGFILKLQFSAINQTLLLELYREIMGNGAADICQGNVSIYIKTIRNQISNFDLTDHVQHFSSHQYSFANTQAGCHNASGLLQLPYHKQTARPFLPCSQNARPPPPRRPCSLKYTFDSNSMTLESKVLQSWSSNEVDKWQSFMDNDSILWCVTRRKL